MSGFAAWERYEAWNQAFSQVLFGSHNEGQPVYLDMDDDILDKVAVAAGVSEADAKNHLVSAVRETLYMDASDGAVFARQLTKLRRWRRAARLARTRGEEPEPPPVIALLAVFTLAAEGMQFDGEFAAGAYYPRLVRLLDVAEKYRQRFEDAYRNHAEELWRGLNEWLTLADGRLGLPTAYSLGKRYIGLPLSQALVRDVDRREFPNLFRRFGLAPGSDISPGDMELLFGTWLEMRPCPVSRSLEMLWQRGDARERIASVAALELRSWDGSGGNTEAGGTAQPGFGDVQLLCWKHRFPKPRLNVTFVARLGRLPLPDALTVLTANEPPSIAMKPVPGNRLQPTRVDGIDGPSLIEGVLRLRDESSGHEVARPPRRIVPLRRDDLLNAYVESERIQLGEDSAVLVKDDRGLLASARNLLGEIARPGFQEESDLPGLPAGWTLFTSVQVLACPATDAGNDLNPLVPLLSSQLTIAGGTRLPGRMRKWSSLDPPEIRAVIHGTAGVSVVLTALNEDNAIASVSHTWSSPDTALVADVGALHLPDGDYELVLKSGKRNLQQAVLRLRSSDTPDTSSFRQAVSLAHAYGADPLAAIRARDFTGNDSEAHVVRGSFAPEPHGAAAVKRTAAIAGSRLWWTAAPRPRPLSVPAISLDPPDAASCVVTGAHHMELPLYDGHKQYGLVNGRCRKCGLVKRYPARIRWRERDGKKPRAGQEIPEPASIAELPVVAEEHAGWDVAVDCLVHARGGSRSTLEHVAYQVEGSRLFADSFAQSLEARGDLEIRRNRDLAIEAWEIAPAYLAELAVGGYLLTGGWNTKARNKLRRHVERAGGTFTARRERRGLARYIVSGLDQDELEKIAGVVGSAGVVTDAATRIAQTLPPLSVLEAALPRITMPGARHIERFHVESASWAPARFAAEPGAYRLRSAHTVTDVYRTAADIERGEAALSTVHLSKHLAARHHGRALVAYAPERKWFAVPLGAELPGLYGRAVVLCGGRLPGESSKNRALVYQGVPQHIADILTALLMS